MLRRFSKFYKELDARVKVTIACTGIHSWGQRLTSQYNLLYVAELGAGPFELGLLNSISSVITSIVSVPLGWVAERYSVKKVMLLGFACAALSAVIYITAGDWWMLIPAFIIGGRIVRIMPLTDIIFISATEPQRRASIMSLSRVVWGALNIFAPIIAALIVTSYGGINVQGIRPLYYVQLVLTIFVFLLVTWKLEPLPSQIDHKRDGVKSRVDLLQDYRDFFKGERWLKRFIALRIVRQFGMSLAMPFIPLWIVNVKGATPYILGTMGTLATIMGLILQIPAGRLSDRIGRKKAYFLLRPISFLGTFILILAPGPEYLILAGLLGTIAMAGGGGIGGVSHTPFITMFWEMVPQEKRGRWFGIEGLMNISSIPASVLGGILWQRGFMTEVMVLPILLELFVAMPILATIPDTLIRPDQ